MTKKRRKEHKHNPIAQDLRTPKYRSRVVPSKKKNYSRNKKQWQKDIEAAVSVLKRDGWCRGSFTNDRTGAHCALGALTTLINESAKSGDEYANRVQRAEIELELFLRKKFGRRIGLIYWNDKVAESAASVMKTMLECAKNKRR